MKVINQQNNSLRNKQKIIVEQLYIQPKQLDDGALGKLTWSHHVQTTHIVFDRSFAGALRHAFRKEPLKLKQGTCVKNKRECLNNHEIFSHRYFFDSKFYDRGSVWISNKEK